MSWYNYLFAAISAFGILAVLGFGFPHHVQKRNTQGMVYASVMLAIWAALFYWNVS